MDYPPQKVAVVERRPLVKIFKLSLIVVTVKTVTINILISLQGSGSKGKRRTACR